MIGVAKVATRSSRVTPRLTASIARGLHSIQAEQTVSISDHKNSQTAHSTSPDGTIHLGKQFYEKLRRARPQRRCQDAVLLGRLERVNRALAHLTMQFAFLKEGPRKELLRSSIEAMYQQRDMINRTVDELNNLTVRSQEPEKRP